MTLVVLFLCLCPLLFAQDPSKCIYPDGNGGNAILNLSSLAGTKIEGGTSTFNTYQFSPCANEYSCKGKCMINQVSQDDGSCACLMPWDDGDAVPGYFSSQKTWEFQYFSDNYFVRVWWICNETATNPYIRFTGMEADGMFGFYIDTNLACVSSSDSNSDVIIKDELTTPESYSCTDMGGCSYNGQCKNGKCECFPQWKGTGCAELNVVPTPKDNGLASIIDGQRVSSWGGSVIQDDNGTYWMYSAEMGYFCGINAWLSNSIVVMAKATKFTSNGIPYKFERIEGDAAIVSNLFSHEPTATRALNTGEYVLYYSSIYPPPTNAYPCTGCSQGESLDCDPMIPRNWDSPIPTQMIYSKNPNGPWSDPVEIKTQDEYIDSNLATYIFPNGSMVGIGRADAIYIWHAEDWKEKSTYKYTALTLPKDCCGEDPFIWFDTRYNVFHIIWHDGGWDDPKGVHTWSTDNGYTWHNIPNVLAYQNTVQFTDNTSFSFQRRERPHLIMAKDGYTPLALTNAVENGGMDCDYSHTLVQPLNQS